MSTSAPETSTCSYPGCAAPLAPPPEGGGRPSRYCTDAGHTRITAYAARRATRAEQSGTPAPDDLGRPVSMAGARASEHIATLAGQASALQASLTAALEALGQLTDVDAAGAQVEAVTADAVRDVSAAAARAVRAEAAATTATVEREEADAAAEAALTEAAALAEALALAREELAAEATAHAATRAALAETTARAEALALDLTATRQQVEATTEQVAVGARALENERARAGQAAAAAAGVLATAVAAQQSEAARAAEQAQRADAALERAETLTRDLEVARTTAGAQASAAASALATAVAERDAEAVRVTDARTYAEARLADQARYYDQALAAAGTGAPSSPSGAQVRGDEAAGVVLDGQTAIDMPEGRPDDEGQA